MNVGDFPRLNQGPVAADLRRRAEQDGATIERLGRMCVTAHLRRGPWRLSAAEADQFCSHLEQQALRNGRRLDYAHAAEQISLPSREGHAAIVQQKMGPESGQDSLWSLAQKSLRASAGLVAQTAVAPCLVGVAVGLGVIRYALRTRPLARVMPERVQQMVHVLKQKVDKLIGKISAPRSPRNANLMRFLRRAKMERNLFLGESVFFQGHGPAQWWQIRIVRPFPLLQPGHLRETHIMPPLSPLALLLPETLNRPQLRFIHDQSVALSESPALVPFREMADAVEARRETRTKKILGNCFDVPRDGVFWASRSRNNCHCSFPRLETAVMLAVLSERCLAAPFAP